MDSLVLGKLGEDYAVGYLISKGYKVISRNLKAKYFEIDIIAVKENSLYFIEVKTRSGFEVYEHYKSVSNFKLTKIKRGINSFLLDKPVYNDFCLEIKVLMILINPYNSKPKFVFYEYLD